MNANELRIGNFIQKYDGTIITVDGSLIRDLEINGNLQLLSNPPIDALSYISLTEEWLLKLGFKRYWELQDAFPSFLGKVTIMATAKQNIFNCNECELEIKYVHQLQNLFFALIGDELTIKE